MQYLGDAADCRWAVELLKPRENIGTVPRARGTFPLFRLLPSKGTSGLLWQRGREHQRGSIKGKLLSPSQSKTDGRSLGRLSEFIAGALCTNPCLCSCIIMPQCLRDLLERCGLGVPVLCPLSVSGNPRHHDNHKTSPTTTDLKGVLGFRGGIWALE